MTRWCGALRCLLMNQVFITASTFKIKVAYLSLSLYMYVYLASSSAIVSYPDGISCISRLHASTISYLLVILTFWASVAAFGDRAAAMFSYQLAEKVANGEVNVWISFYNKDIMWGGRNMHYFLFKNLLVTIICIYAHKLYVYYT